LIKIKAEYFDGISSSSNSVEVEFFEDKRVLVKSKEIDLFLELNYDQLNISSRVGNTHRVIQIDQDRLLHTFDNDKIDQVTKNISNKSSIIYLLESKLKYSILSFILLIMSIVFFLTIGADISAKLIAHITPQELKNDISTQTLEVFDEYILKKSRLDKSRQEEIRYIFNDLTKNSSNYKLHFRRGMGINAFALPSGDIVILDELVKFCKDSDEMIYGILAHEMAHVKLGHSMQIIVKSSIVGALVAYFTGDVSSVVSTVGATILQANYSQEFEKEADLYAKRVMLKNGKDPKHLAEFFIKINKKYRKDKNSSGYGIFSSHPDNDDRVRVLLTK
jgi:Zn-dependent protease with chaperone function